MAPRIIEFLTDSMVMSTLGLMLSIPLGFLMLFDQIPTTPFLKFLVIIGVVMYFTGSFIYFRRKAISIWQKRGW